MEEFFNIFVEIKKSIINFISSLLLRTDKINFVRTSSKTEKVGKQTSEVFAIN